MGTTEEGRTDTTSKEPLAKIWEDLITQGLVDPDKLPQEVRFDMVAKLCFANSARSRLVRLSGELDKVLEDTQFLLEALSLIREGRHAQAYDRYQRNYGKLLWMMGMFEQVTHRTVSTFQFDALAAPLRASLMQELGEPNPAQGDNYTGSPQFLQK